jgi:hypothetical protein
MQWRSFIMKIALLSAFLLVGTASAAPEKTENRERISYSGDARRDTSNKPDDGWIELASPTPASHGREFIPVDPSAEAFVRLKLTADSGRPIVRRVRVHFSDGTQRLVRLDRAVDKKHPVMVDLKVAKRIDRLVVETEGSKKATYSVYGEPDSRAIATR